MRETEVSQGNLGGGTWGVAITGNNYKLRYMAQRNCRPRLSERSALGWRLITVCHRVAGEAFVLTDQENPYLGLRPGPKG